jgi:hypothetical protein
VDQHHVTVLGGSGVDAIIEGGDHIYIPREMLC